MVEFTKREREELRRLAGEVYEAEVHALLDELEASFRQWRDGKLLSSELLRIIHEFHQHQSRDLWSMYQSLRDPDIVARGLARGLLAETELSRELLVKLRPAVAGFSH